MKENIQNRKNCKVAVLIEEEENKNGIVFLMHGLGYNKDYPCIKVVSECFRDNGYSTIRFDTTNSSGESEGNPEDSTVTGYYEDLEDVINWAKNKRWYHEPFILVGHSVGGLCIMLYAEKFPSKIKALFIISSIISGMLAIEQYPSEMLKTWKESGIFQWKDEGKIKKLKWACIEDSLKYNALTKINSLTMPVLIIVGEDDIETPIKHQEMLYKIIPGKKDLKIIAGAGHKLREKNELDEIRKIFDSWINN